MKTIHTNSLVVLPLLPLEIAGVSAQLYQAYGDANGGALPPAALIKAALINTANDVGNVGPDYKFGWGIVNALEAVKIIENNQYLSDEISQGKFKFAYY